jgi:hypothetical protein
MRRTASSTVALLVVASAAACGSSGSAPSTNGNGFVASVDGICSRAVAAHQGHPFPVANFDPEHPKPSQLPAVGNYLARYGGLAATAARLHRVTPPADSARQWQTVLGLVDQVAANSRRQIQAARAANVTGFLATLPQVKTLSAQLNAAGASLGFTSNSPCEQIFG